jgi:tetratricopeptide (TPR) repeat protein
LLTGFRGGVALAFLPLLLASVARVGAEDKPLSEAEKHCERARKLEADNDLKGAEAEYREALKADPKMAATYNDLGVLVARQERYADALALFDQALAAQADYHNASVNKGVVLFRSGKKPEGVAELEAVTKIAPSFARARFELGNVYDAGGELSKACGAYRECLKLDETDAEAHNNLAWCLFRQHLYEDALAEFRLAIKHAPNAATPHNNMGWVLFQMGRLRDAAREFEQAIKLNPDLPEAYNNLGQALMVAQELEGGLAQFRKATEVAPKYAPAYLNLGKYLFDLGRLQEAIAPLEKYLELVPQFADADKIRDALAKAKAGAAAEKPKETAAQ